MIEAEVAGRFVSQCVARDQLFDCDTSVIPSTMPNYITSFETHGTQTSHPFHVWHLMLPRLQDIRFETSLTGDGSDAM